MLGEGYGEQEEDVEGGKDVMWQCDNVVIG